MKVTKEQAVKILDMATIEEDWVECCSALDCYNSKTDDWPTFLDVMEALGVSNQETQTILKGKHFPNHNNVASAFFDMYDAVSLLLHRLDEHGCIDPVTDAGPIEDARLVLQRTQTLLDLKSEEDIND